MLILKLSQKKYKDVSQTMKNHTQKLIKSTQIVDMGIRSSVVMMTNTVNQYVVSARIADLLIVSRDFRLNSSI